LTCVFALDLSFLFLTEVISAQERIIIHLIKSADSGDELYGLNEANTMSLSFYSASVPVFKQFLNNLKGLLGKAESYSQGLELADTVLLQSRLYPDMFPLVRQVQIAADFAKSVSARLAGVEVPSYEDNEQTFAELQQRLDKTLAFLNTLSAEQFANAAEKEIVLRAGTPKEKRFTGTQYLTQYGLPQFYFHITTCYALLRNNGVEIGKKDYMGQI
jgi:hypothetical protein